MKVDAWVRVRVRVRVRIRNCRPSRAETVVEEVVEERERENDIGTRTGDIGRN